MRVGEMFLICKKIESLCNSHRLNRKLTGNDQCLKGRDMSCQKVGKRKKKDTCDYRITDIIRKV